MQLSALRFSIASLAATIFDTAFSINVRDGHVAADTFGESAHLRRELIRRAREDPVVTTVPVVDSVGTTMPVVEAEADAATEAGYCEVGDTVEAVWAKDGKRYDAVVASIDQTDAAVNWADGSTGYRKMPSSDVFKNGKQCTGCTDCASAPSPTPSPELVCKSWCSGKADQWEVKCGWSNCEGCSVCFEAMPATQCPKWCAKIKKNAKRKGAVSDHLAWTNKKCSSCEAVTEAVANKTVDDPVVNKETVKETTVAEATTCEAPALLAKMAEAPCVEGQTINENSWCTPQCDKGYIPWLNISGLTAACSQTAPWGSKLCCSGGVLTPATFLCVNDVFLTMDANKDGGISKGEFEVYDLRRKGNESGAAKVKKAQPIIEQSKQQQAIESAKNATAEAEKISTQDADDKALILKMQMGTVVLLILICVCAACCRKKEEPPDKMHHHRHHHHKSATKSASPAATAQANKGKNAHGKGGDGKGAHHKGADGKGSHGEEKNAPESNIAMPAYTLSSDAGDIDGDYELHHKRAHGFSVWKHTKADYFIYCGAGLDHSGKRWFIAGSDAEKIDFGCDNGIASTQTAHDGTFPHLITEDWLRYDDTGSSQPDSSIKIRAKPPTAAAAQASAATAKQA